MKKNDGGRAFPDPGRAQSEKQREKLTETGMSLRAYIATECCAAMVSTIRNDGDYMRLRQIAKDHDLNSVSEFFAHESVKQADALIAALNGGAA